MKIIDIPDPVTIKTKNLKDGNIVDAELAGKAQSGKGNVEAWVRGGVIEEGAGAGPWLHYREKVAASGLLPEREESRNPAIALADANMNSIGTAAVAAVGAAIA